MRLRFLGSLALILLAGSEPAPHAQGTGSSLEDVLSRAGEYVSNFSEQLAGVVAEERYTQDSIPDTTYVPGAGRGNSQQHRELRSDLLLVRPKGADRWVQFRDVFEVDGREVRDRNSRLLKLFLLPWSSILDQVWAIADEGARYNIGNLQRNINVPVLPLLFLDAANQSRFEFERVAPQPARSSRRVVPQNLPSRSAFAVPPEAWEIRYREVKPNTLIRTTGDRDLPASGRFWIEPLTGRVLLTEFLLEDPFVRATIDVSYQSQPMVGFLLPIEMREDYRLVTSKARITGAATYSRFRQFQVNTDEKMVPR